LSVLSLSLPPSFPPLTFDEGVVDGHHLHIVPLQADAQDQAADAAET
jgi:hypothetical protein